MSAKKWTIMAGVVILFFLLQFKTPLIMVGSDKGSPISIQFLSKIIKPFEDLTVFADEEPGADPGNLPDPGQGSDNYPTPDPEPTPEPEPEPEPEPDPDPDPIPDPKPKPKPNPSPNPDPKPNPKPTTKPNPAKKPVVKKNSFKGTETLKNTKKESNHINSSHTNNTNNTNNTSKTTDESLTTEENNKNVEEELDEGIEEEVNINELSIEQLIVMLEKGELKWEANADKYLIMLTEGEGQRVLTSEEAVKLGIVEEDSENDELVDDQDEEETDDENEVTSDKIEEVQLLSDNKNKKGKAPFYISAIGLITVLTGSLMYFIQWRKN